MMKSVLAVLSLALALEWARGEWVQVAVIDARKPATPPGPQGPKGPQGPEGPQGPKGPLGPEGPALHPVASDRESAPGPSVDDVITIRRRVGDSFSNKHGIVPGALPSAAVDERPEPEDREEDHHVQDEGLPLRVLREAHQTLLRQSTAPVSGKLEFLRRLKNRMLRHIATLMPVSALSLVGAAATGRSLGSSFGADVEGRGHKGVGFPSNESTLMSLAFLVFAVFLVKVVMQLIYAVQNSQASNNVGVRVAQMQIPGGGMSNMMGTMMSMVPAMMPPMMATMGGMRAARGEQAPRADMNGLNGDVDKMTSRVLDAIQKARARVEHLGVALD